MRGQRRPDQRVMTGQYPRVIVFSQPPEQRSRALNVGEQEREGLHGHSLEGRPGGGSWHAPSRQAAHPEGLPLEHEKASFLVR
jgi:hypothetical protein